MPPFVLCVIYVQMHEAVKSVVVCASTHCLCFAHTYIMPLLSCACRTFSGKMCLFRFMSCSCSNPHTVLCIYISLCRSCDAAYHPHFICTHTCTHAMAHSTHQATDERTFLCPRTNVVRSCKAFKQFALNIRFVCGVFYCGAPSNNKKQTFAKNC